jgi:hypothetical protein
VVNDRSGLIRAEGDDHFECILQNKANFRKGQMDANSIIAKDYESEFSLGGYENKANQTQFARGQRKQVRPA